MHILIYAINAILKCETSWSQNHRHAATNLLSALDLLTVVLLLTSVITFLSQSLDVFYHMVGCFLRATIVVDI